MADLRVITHTGTEAALRETDVADFTKSLRGHVLRPDDDGYEDTRALRAVLDLVAREAINRR